MKEIIKNIIAWVLSCEARLVIKKYHPRIVGVTGNVGKTGTKDAIAAVLSKKFVVGKSAKSFNSELGVPLSILGIQNSMSDKWSKPFLWLKNICLGFVPLIWRENYPEWLVLEIGADKPGDILSVSKWLHLNVVVITAIGDIPVHVEFFRTVEELAREKGYLVEAIRPGGDLVLFADDKWSAATADRLKVCAGVLTYGFSKSAMIKASNYRISSAGISFRIDYDGKMVPVKMPGVYGRPNVYAVLAAIAVGASHGVNLIEAVDAVLSYERPPGRFKRLEGINDSIIFDDSYNASPLATDMALQTFSELKASGRKIVALGDMRELGQYSDLAHRDIGRKIAKIADIFVVVGEKSRIAARAAEGAGMKGDNIFCFSDSIQAGEFLKTIISSGDMILVKGSESIRMERVVASIINNPEDVSKLLVRQNKEWLGKS
ncbi:MAG: UDP-N-acetylmuramoyl-tripeptide--D-alanyl-D-alanine ligase [Candidatus Vogelbacteria bacterium]|nr:UDP-N-acetylmuramoyl-tripeptide--D-alanyl-D-alanine ligase [Candidatus Vogelbacteria bacterium]